MFHCSDKTHERNNLKGEKVYFGLQFQRFQSMVTWSQAFGPVVKQYITAAVCSTGNLFTPWRSGRQKKKRQKEARGPISKDTSSVIYFPHNRPHLLKVPLSIVPQAGLWRREDI
jgi:hypothetical protein